MEVAWLSWCTFFREKCSLTVLTAMQSDGITLLVDWFCLFSVLWVREVCLQLSVAIGTEGTWSNLSITAVLPWSVCRRWGRP